MISANLQAKAETPESIRKSQDRILETILHDPAAVSELQYLIEQLQTLSSVGLLTKLDEDKNRNIDRTYALIGELRLAFSLSKTIGSPPEFLIGNRADFKFRASGCDVYVEVQNKSPHWAIDSIFVFDPENPPIEKVPESSSAAARFRLHRYLKTHAVKITPLLRSALEEPCWSGEERTQQDTLAANLANELLDILELESPIVPQTFLFAHAAISVEPIEKPPGFIGGGYSLEAHWVHNTPIEGVNK